MDQPTGDKAPTPAATGPAKDNKPMLIGGGVALALLVGGGLWFESSGEVGKAEKIQVDETDLGKLRARTLREVGSFEASLSGMPEDTAKQIRPHLMSARADAVAAKSIEEMEKARDTLQTVRALAGGKVPPSH